MMNISINSETIQRIKQDRNIKLSIVFILIFVFRTNDWVTNVLVDFGIPALRYQKLWFFLLPGVYILFHAYHNRRLNLKYFLLFLIFYCVHYFMENNSYGVNYDPGNNLDLLWRIQYLFMLFIFLINAGEKYMGFIFKSTIIILFFNTLLIYLDLFNIINVGNIEFGQGANTGRLSSYFNLNGVNDQNVFGIYILIFLKYLKYPEYKFFTKQKLIWFIIISFIILIIIQASRGSLLLLLVGVVIYTFDKWKTSSPVLKIAVVLVIIFISIMQLNILNIASENIYVIHRLTETPSDIKSEEEGRALQITASWHNFLSSPYIGVGYNNAAASISSGIYRSNFQYTQILASGGLILFSIYFLLIYKLFVNRIKLFLNDKIVFSICAYVFILFIFRRPDVYLGIFAYFVYYRSLFNTYHRFSYLNRNPKIR